MVNYGNMTGKLSSNGKLSGSLSNNHGSLSASLRSTNGGTVTEKDYNKLDNKPSINTHILVGDSNFEDIGLHFMTNVELQQLLGG